MRRWAWGLLGVAATVVMLGLLSRMEATWVALAWVAMVPWLAVLERTRSVREALVVGLALAVGFCVWVFGWFPTALQDYTGGAQWVSWLVLGVGAPLLEPQFLTAAVARHLAGRGGGSRAWAALAGALVYVGTEWAWPKLFSDTFGHGLYGSTYLRQGADLAGSHGLTLVLLLANECVLALSPLMERAARSPLSLWERAGVRVPPVSPGSRHLWAPAALLCALVATSYVYGYARYQQVVEHIKQSPQVGVGIVQANITRYDRLAEQIGRYEVVRLVLDTHYAMSDELLGSARPDVLIWPETVYPLTFGTPRSEDGAALDGEIERFVSERGVPLVFGAYEAEGGSEYNAAHFLGLGGEGRPERASYRKTWLFPMTEWVPESVDSPRLREWLPWTGYWKRGPGPKAVELRLRGGERLKVGPLICYETLFVEHVAGSVRQGAELLLTLSNDSWFGKTEGSRLHLAMATFRSIETRRAQVRATNSGISAVIDPTGEIVAQAGADERAVLSGRVARVKGLWTPVVGWGAWLGPLALVAGLGLVVGARWRGRGATARGQRPAGSV